MTLYQGRALHRARPTRRSRGTAVLRVLALAGLLVGLASLPWEALRHRVASVREVRVAGLRTMDAERVVAQSAVHTGDDLYGLDLDEVRQRLLAYPRIASARVSRHGLGTVVLDIEEREPVLLVRHGEPWEIDSTGTLLEPLARGVVADVPLLAGPDLAALPAGSQVRTLEVQRGLAWTRALAARDLQLAGRVSEVDVSDPAATSLLLMDGTRVLTPPWPPDTRRLSALRVVLADLAQRGTLAREVDLRFENQVIVRPVAPPAPGEGTGTQRS